jgi:hypothetical protein
MGATVPESGHPSKSVRSIVDIGTKGKHYDGRQENGNKRQIALDLIENNT